MSIATLDELKTQVSDQGSSSSAFRQIGQYVADHLRDVSLMSAVELAEACDVSQSTVSRFCMSLGFSGFADFVRTLQDLVREEWKAPDRTRYLHHPTPSEDDPLIAEEMTNLSQLPLICESTEAKAMVQFILRSPRLVLAGARASATMMPYAAYFLSKIRDSVECATPDTPQWTALASHVQPDTAVLAFVFPRYSAVLLDWLADVARWATPIAAITDRPHTPVESLARPVAVVPVARASLFDSYAAVMVFINYLIREAAAATPNIEARLQALEDYETRRHVYRP
ncbi:MurR/RpiR family transcriptional regulator [Sulfobacillus harzensis]|uniref:MurR/RpiR family transcriptional regulator n=1 Tax=Sulfobacillus harzensis TaxID=2729629 RepID=A0A7Y0L7A2_9FIRM|nr:MurR/RpiR family transcriptional regulator [Sulfobacillus harzensis]NMP24535.1 MurR/RpiR family transcriptional regulator [Sulfobacillus harzensis]